MSSRTGYHLASMSSHEGRVVVHTSGSSSLLERETLAAVPCCTHPLLATSRAKASIASVVNTKTVA